jgi:hypothetical protein
MTTRFTFLLMRSCLALWGGLAAGCGMAKPLPSATSLSATQGRPGFVETKEAPKPSRKRSAVKSEQLKAAIERGLPIREQMRLKRQRAAGTAPDS